MSELQTISIVIAASGLFIAAINQILSNRRAEKTQQLTLETRQAQLFMEYRTGGTEEASKSYQDVMFRQEWTTWSEYLEKYGMMANPDAAAKVLHTTMRFNTVAFLAEEGLIGVNLIYRFNGPAFINGWERLEPYIMGVRNNFNFPTYCNSFEWLYKQFKKIQDNELPS